MAEETIDPGVLEQTKNQIRKLVSEIAELAEADIQPQEFHGEFLSRVVAAVAASGGALWLLDGRGGLRLQNELEFRQTGLMDGRARNGPHDALLACMAQASQPQIIPPGATVEGMAQAGNPTAFSLIIAPLIVDKQPVGLVEVLMDPTRRAATQKSTLRFISDLCDLAVQYLKNRQMRQMMSQQRLWNQLEGFTHAIHNSLDLKEACFSVANDGKRLVGVDRLSVILKVGGRTMVEAISGQEIVEQRANLVREMTRLGKSAIHAGEDLVYTGSTEGFPPEIRDGLEYYVDESGSKAVIITILHKPETDPSKEKVPFGCLISEQIGDEVAPTDAQARAEVVARHASTALWNAQKHSKIFGRPLLEAMGSPLRLFRGRTFAKILAVLGLILTLILVMALVPWELTVEGRGSLLPQQRQIVYAPWQSVVTTIPEGIQHGTLVKKGDVLLELESKELTKELERVRGEYSEAANRITFLNQQLAQSGLRPDEKAQFHGELAEAEIRRQSATEQRKILEEQLAMLTVRAPIDGVIISPFEIRKDLMNRPVEVGQELVQVATMSADAENEWVMEVDVDDSDMGPILDARERLAEAKAAGKVDADTPLEAYFVSATDPEHRYRGYVKRIASKAETKEAEHVVKVEVVFPPERSRRLPRPQPRAPPRCRGPGPDRVRRRPPGLRPVPRRHPLLVRNRPVPLAVPQLTSSSNGPFTAMSNEQ